MGTFKHYDLRTSLEVAELNSRSNEDLGAKTKSKITRERERGFRPSSRERVSQSLKLRMNEM